MIEGESTQMCGITCYITMTCNHYVSSQHTMRELKGSGVMFLGVLVKLQSTVWIRAR